MRDQMTFIGEQEIAPAEPLRRAPHALDAGKNDRRIPIASLEPRTVDADRRRGPQPKQMLEILFEQLAHVHEHERSKRGVLLCNLTDELCEENAFAGGGRHGDQRVSATGVPIGVERPQSRSEEHTSELQSLRHLVCRLLLEKNKKRK